MSPRRTCEAPPALAGEAAWGVDASAVRGAVGSPAHALVDVNGALWTFIPASTRILFSPAACHTRAMNGVQGFVHHPGMRMSQTGKLTDLPGELLL